MVLFARSGLWGGMLNLIGWIARRYGAGAPGAATVVQDLEQVVADGGE